MSVNYFFLFPVRAFPKLSCLVFLFLLQILIVKRWKVCIMKGQNIECYFVYHEGYTHMLCLLKCLYIHILSFFSFFSFFFCLGVYVHASNMPLCPSNDDKDSLDDSQNKVK